MTLWAVLTTCKLQQHKTLANNSFQDQLSWLSSRPLQIFASCCLRYEGGYMSACVCFARQKEPEKKIGIWMKRKLRIVYKKYKKSKTAKPNSENVKVVLIIIPGHIKNTDIKCCCYLKGANVSDISSFTVGFVKVCKVWAKCQSLLKPVLLQHFLRNINSNRQQQLLTFTTGRLRDSTT